MQSGSPSRPKDGSLLGCGPHQSYCAVLNLLVLSHLIKCLNRPDKTEKWDFKKKKKRKNGKEAGVHMLGVTSNATASRADREERGGKGCSTSSAQLMCSFPENPKKALASLQTPPPSPARAEGWDEEAMKGGDRIHPICAVKLGSA